MIENGVMHGMPLSKLFGYKRSSDALWLFAVEREVLISAWASALLWLFLTGYVTTPTARRIVVCLASLTRAVWRFHNVRGRYHPLLFPSISDTNMVSLSLLVLVACGLPFPQSRWNLVRVRKKFLKEPV